MNEKNFVELRHSILDKLKASLSPHLHYHCMEHTIRVLDVSEFIAKRKGVQGHHLMLIKLAALFHDTGFLYTIKDHEEVSCKIAKEELAPYHLDSADLKLIYGMIMATKIPQTVHNLQEAIIADADLEYLGTEDFFEISDQFFQELKHRMPDLDYLQYDKIQIDFLENHHYFTDYAQRELAPVKAQNLEAIKARYQHALAGESH